MTRRQSYDHRERQYQEHLNWCSRCGRAEFHRELCRVGRRARGLRDRAWLRVLQLQHEQLARYRFRNLVLT